MFFGIRRRLASAWSEFQCWLFSHSGAYRQWEWTPTSPGWVERTDGWNCIRCDAELGAEVPAHMPRYAVERPFMHAEFIEAINIVIEEVGAENVRVRSGKPDSVDLLIHPPE